MSAARAGIERCYGIDCLGEFVRFGERWTWRPGRHRHRNRGDQIGFLDRHRGKHGRSPSCRLDILGAVQRRRSNSGATTMVHW